MEQFRQFTNGKGLFIGVDFGHGKDFAVETIIQRQADGGIKILASNIIGRAEDYKSEDKREQKCKEYERLCENEAVEQKSTRRPYRWFGKCNALFQPRI